MKNLFQQLKSIFTYKAKKEGFKNTSEVLSSSQIVMDIHNVGVFYLEKIDKSECIKQYLLFKNQWKTDKYLGFYDRQVYDNKEFSFFIIGNLLNNLEKVELVVDKNNCLQTRHKEEFESFFNTQKKYTEGYLVCTEDEMISFLYKNICDLIRWCKEPEYNNLFISRHRELYLNIGTASDSPAPYSELRYDIGIGITTSIYRMPDNKYFLINCLNKDFFTKCIN